MARGTKLTTDIRKLAAKIIVVSTDEGVDAIAGEIVTKANLIDARDERKKPSVRRRRAAKRKPAAKRKRPAAKVARRHSRPKTRRPSVARRRPALVDNLDSE